MHSTKWRLFAFVFILFLTDRSNAATRTVAFRSDAAPGIPASQFNSFTSPPVLNDHGEVAFIATTSGTQTVGVWSEGGGNGLRLVARSNVAAPGTLGLNFSSFRNIVLNNPGQTLVEGVVSTGAVGLWMDDLGGNFDLIAIERAQPPGVPPGVTLNSFMGDSFGSVSPSPPLLNDAGQTAFRGLIAGPGINNITNNDKGLWTNSWTAALAPIALSRDASTGVVNGTDFIGFGQPTMNNHGAVAFDGYVGPSGGINGPYVADPTTGLATVASTAGGAFSNLITPPHINDAGDVAFWAIGTGGMGIYSKPAGGVVAPVVRGNVPAPGAGNGVRFEHYFGPALNADGHVAFAALLNGSGVTSLSNKGIWVQNENGLTLVARTGAPAPGMSGTPFSGLSDVVTFNGRGQVAFTGKAGTDGIWATDEMGVLHLIAAAGSVIDVDNGPGLVLRTVSTLAMFANHGFNGGIGNQDGFASGFNELGQLAFSATFTDGSHGVFVSNLVAIPEPNSLWVAALILTMCSRPSRRG